MNNLSRFLSTLDLLRKTIPLLKRCFLTTSFSNFSAICTHIPSKFQNEFVQKSSVFSRKANYAKGLLFFWILLLSFSLLHSRVFSSEPGTLIITYQTNQQMDRLDRIRFWLINDHQERSLYPKKNESVTSSHSGHEKTVVISRLPPGSYQIEFVIPNIDGFFEEVPIKHINITPGSSVKVDQTIHPRQPTPQQTQTLKTEFLTEPLPIEHVQPLNKEAETPPLNHPLQDEQSNETALVIIQHNTINPAPKLQRMPVPVLPPARVSVTVNKEVQWKLLHDGQILITHTGSISRVPIRPGHNITLLADEIPGFNFYTIPPTPFEIKPHEDFQVQIIYEKNKEASPPDQKGEIHIQTDSFDAQFTLINEGGVILGQGKGNTYIFTDLKPGDYTLEYSSTDPSLKPPPPQHVTVNDGKASEIKTFFHRVGTLVLKIQEPMHIDIATARDKQKVVDQIITEKLNTFLLPEGHYLLTYSPANFDSKNSKSMYVTIHNIFPRTLELFTSPGSLPSSIQEPFASLHPKETKAETASRFIEVPAGNAIIGDPFTDNRQNERPAREISIPSFSIAPYTITNAEYAEWLTAAFQNKKVVFEPQQPGVILNTAGQLLCKTMEASPLAQLGIQIHQGSIQIKSVIGKEKYPVIYVTWEGARSYCSDKGGRLASESEWEKAAGMSFPSNGSLGKRFKYGFGADEIDRTWANYRDNTRSKETSQVLTNPVGFYNGVNMLPLTILDQTSLKTHNAKSPIGAYDMSGNVWEWVADRDEKNPASNSNIVKGGCYDSTAEGVRVSERLALPPGYCDQFTGFRMAKSKV